jgi:hypothetical protein
MSAPRVILLDRIGRRCVLNRREVWPAPLNLRLPCVKLASNLLHLASTTQMEASRNLFVFSWIRISVQPVIAL